MPEHIFTVPPQHRQLLQLTTERAEVCYLRGRRKGYETPAVFILDFDDPVAISLQQPAGRERETAAFIAKARQENGSPVATWFMPTETAAGYVPKEYIDIRDALSDWPARSLPDFPVIVVSEGVVSLAALPAPRLS